MHKLVVPRSWSLGSTLEWLNYSDMEAYTLKRLSASLARNTAVASPMPLEQSEISTIWEAMTTQVQEYQKGTIAKPQQLPVHWSCHRVNTPQLQEFIFPLCEVLYESSCQLSLFHAPRVFSARLHGFAASFSALKWLKPPIFNSLPSLAV